MTTACLTAQAAISVGPGGSTLETFNTTPAATEFATGVLVGGGGTYADIASLDAGANTVSAVNVVRTLPTSTTLPPSSFSGGFRHNNNASGLFLQSRPTTDSTNAAGVLLATLQNDSGGDINNLTISYNFNTTPHNSADELPGFRVFWSATGAPGSWTLVPNLSSVTNSGPQADTVAVGAWANGTTLYLLWVDDNSSTGGTDSGYTIDNFIVTGGSLPLAVTLTAPTNSVLVAPATVAASATASGGTAPVTSVSFFTNGVLHSTDTTAPYTDSFANLPDGIYTVFARASNGVDTDADSATATLIVRGEYINYTSGIHTENFDGMTAAGIVTPQGWWVGAAAAGTAQFVTVSDGSAGPSATSHGYNHGLISDSDRALGTSPTGTERNVVARLRNIGTSNIVSFNLFFDVELWRTHQTNTHIETITNYVSYDLGATWIPTTFDANSPNTIDYPAATAMDGNQATNRVSSLGGPITPPIPVPPGAVLYVRWKNPNDAGTDGALAVDNFSFEATAFSPAVTFVNITSPTNGQSISGGCVGSANVTVNANATFTTTNVIFVLDGGTTINDDTVPYSVTFSGVTLGAHSIVATAQDASGSTVNTNVSFSIAANTSPLVFFTNSYSGGVTGLTFLVGSPVTNQFTIQDTDGTITNVEFYVNGALHYATNLNYSGMVVGNLLAGTNTFLVRAYDNCGGITQNSQLVVGTNPPTVTLLLTNGSLWKYYNSTNSPTNDLAANVWYTAAYDDSAWLSGYAELGGGDAVAPPSTVPERTLLDIGPAGNRNRAAYFRRTFNVVNPAAFGDLIIRSMQDDSSAVYINGTLVATFNATNDVGMPFVYSDGAIEPVDGDGTLYNVSNVLASVLVAGVNTVAVEVHQDSATSSDIGFDLMLWAAPAGGTSLTITPISATQAEIAWPDSTPGTAQLYSTPALGGAWTLVPGTPTQSGGFYRMTVTTSSGERFYTLRQ